VLLDPVAKISFRYLKNFWKSEVVMVFLQSMDKFDDLAELDINTGKISWFSRRADFTAVSRPIQGHIAQLYGRTLCLYRQAGLLHFRVENQDFELTENTHIKLERLHNDVNCITVLRNGAVVFTWTYQRPALYPPIEIDPTPFIEGEHFDFCLFVYNVANDPDRRERIYWQEK
jgi:hypothetical protein